MGYDSLRSCLLDLEQHGHLRRIEAELDPYLEIPAIQRRVYAQQGPALWFSRVKGSRFSAVSNLFGTIERGRFLFRDTIEKVLRIVETKARPEQAIKRPWSRIDLATTAFASLPRRVSGGPVMQSECRIHELPAIHSWSKDGGPFITLPQVFSQDPEAPAGFSGIQQSNLGMYRVQLAGNAYKDNEIGLHYQIHRGIGVHHSRALERGEALKVSIFVGGPPAHTLAAVMPLPEGLSELLFAGMLGRRRFRYLDWQGHIVSTDADFCIVGTIDPQQQKPEGPFGDHLGYYSLTHEFPYLRVEKVFCRKDAIWPFTVVGRPPQEDTTFGALIHELTAPMVPVSIPGLESMHAVDAAGVHPLLLAVGHERYLPYQNMQPRQLLTVANAVLGFGQASLAKYLWIGAAQDEPKPDAHHPREFIQHILERLDFRRDLHFQSKTTIDTLDYSGSGLHEGSKIVIAACGTPRRRLCRELSPSFSTPDAFGPAKLVAPGILALQAPPYHAPKAPLDAPSQALGAHPDARRLSGYLEQLDPSALDGLAWITLVDDAEFCARNFDNWLWVCFTRSNPSHDMHGVHARIEHKHWGCQGPLIVDARIKEHHAPPLEEDPKVNQRIESLATQGGPLHGLL